MLITLKLFEIEIFFTNRLFHICIIRVSEIFDKGKVADSVLGIFPWDLAIHFLCKIFQNPIPSASDYTNSLNSFVDN